MDLRDINVKQVLGFSAKKLMNESIVALAILQMFFSATIPSLKVLQIPVELILFIFLFVACTTVKFNRWQILLLYVSTVITIASFATTELSVSVVNAKQIGLAVLTLLYFSKIKFNSKLSSELIRFRRTNGFASIPMVVSDLNAGDFLK